MADAKCVTYGATIVPGKLVNWHVPVWVDELHCKAVSHLRGWVARRSSVEDAIDSGSVGESDPHDREKAGETHAHAETTWNWRRREEETAT